MHNKHLFHNSMTMVFLKQRCNLKRGHYTVEHKEEKVR